MRFEELPLAGAYVIDLEPHTDERGQNARLFCAAEFAEHGLVDRMVQTNLIVNHRRGTLRGLHFQVAPYREAKLFRVTRGALHDVIADLRPGSPTYGHSTAVRLDAAVPRLLYVPEGFAQGFLTLEDGTELTYQVSAPYTPEAGRGIRWDDPALGIRWPTEVRVISEKDASWPDFDLAAHAGEVGGGGVIIVDRALARREAEGRPVRVGMVGAGAMGRAIALQIATATPGMELVAVFNRTPERGREALALAGTVDAPLLATTRELDLAIAHGRPCLVEDPALICEAAGVDIVLEVTGAVEFGARVVLDAIANGKHVVAMNAELNATLGPILKVRADGAGVVYSDADGDQPGVIMNLERFVRGIGVQPVLLGNLKGLHDRFRNPETQAGFAARKGLTPHMAASFADGSKVSFEMALVANATGFDVLERGMRGPDAEHVKDAERLFDVDELLEHGRVDYLVGAEPAPGVFILGHHEHPLQKKWLELYKLGDGPLYTFYTPYHLCHLEVPTSLARVALFEDPIVTPLGPPVVDVVATAKRDLKAGEVIDGIGHFMTYGQCENVAAPGAAELLPMGLAEGCRLRCDVAVDAVIRLDDVELPEGRLSDRLRAEQAAHFGLATHHPATA